MPNFAESTYEAVTGVRSANPDVVRRGRLLNTVIAGVLLLCALFIPLEALSWRGLPSVITVAIIAVGLGIGIAALQISRLGTPRIAAFLFLGTFWALITAIMLI